MPKLLASDYLLLGLAVLGDLAEEIFIGGGKAYKHGRLFSYFPPGYKKANFTQNIHRQIKNRHLKQEKDQLSLTRVGEQHIRKRFPLVKLQQQIWDKTWCIVSFDVPEKHKHQRNSLRHKLVNVGFAQLHKSIYISPHSFEKEIVEFIKDIGLNQYCFVLKGKQLHLNLTLEKISQMWGLKKIANSYNQLAKSPKKHFIHEYLKVIATDPHLPFQLLPRNWPAKAINNQVKKFKLNNP